MNMNNDVYDVYNARLLITIIRNKIAKTKKILQYVSIQVVFQMPSYQAMIAMSHKISIIRF